MWLWTKEWLTKGHKNWKTWALYNLRYSLDICLDDVQTTGRHDSWRKFKTWVSRTYNRTANCSRVTWLPEWIKYLETLTYFNYSSLISSSDWSFWQKWIKLPVLIQRHLSFVSVLFLAEVKARRQNIIGKKWPYHRVNEGMFNRGSHTALIQIKKFSLYVKSGSARC